MTKNTQINITQAENGFIVNEVMDKHMCVMIESSIVFRSMTELCLFLEGHFDHRAKNIPND